MAKPISSIWFGEKLASPVSLFRFFFFSSRRRHTRCLSDWSSDVCSSDLVSLISSQFFSTQSSRRSKGSLSLEPSQFARCIFSQRSPSGPMGAPSANRINDRSEEHTSELQSLRHLVCRLLLEKKKK